MPKVHIRLESPIESSFRVDQVRGMFDVPHQPALQHEWDVDLPLHTQPWHIGMIVGPSGSGKTTIGARLFPEALFHRGYDWPATAAIVDGFPPGVDGKQITQALSSVGFSSPPHWLKRFAHLSNGQQFRCELARLMLEDQHDIIVFDEFTSVVDRDAAQISSAAVAKALRARRAAGEVQAPKLVALSCHYDVVEWLQPDWIYDTADGTFAWRSLLPGSRRHPVIDLQIHQANTRAWALFRGHHYLSKTIVAAAQCFVATWRDNPVAFTSYLHLPHSTVRNIKREHRTVVLPDYQGVGVGNRLSEWLGAYCKAKGYRFRSVTSHPSMIRHRIASPLWKCDRVGHMKQQRSYRADMNMRATACRARITGGFEYVGPALTGQPSSINPSNNNLLAKV